MKQRLLAGGISYGPMLLSDSPIIAEILSQVGYGHVVIDHEHSVTDVRSGLSMMQAMRKSTSARYPTTEAIIRLPGPNDPVYMKKVLDTLRLPSGVLVPMVDDAATARAVVSSARYPSGKGSDGIRGCAAPYVRATGWGMSISSNEDFMERQCVDDLLIMVQVETEFGVENIAEIAAVPGIDAIFLGPVDLSCSIGKMGQFEDPEVLDLISRAEKAVKASGCMLAGFRSPGRDIESMVQAGYQLICGSLDVGLLREAAKTDLQQAQTSLKKSPAM